MRKTYTVIFTLFGAAICLLHLLGLDPDNAILFHLSVPLWVMAMFTNVHEGNIALVYALTVLFWATCGIFIDWAVSRAKGVRGR